MTPEFQQKLDAQLAAYRLWASDKIGWSGRLVKYSGVELVGAIDIEPDEIEEEIIGLASEGFRLDWNEHAGKVYLCAWEYPGPEPTWNLAFAEENLADVQAILREAGFDV
jgi:hypothetical protein